MAFGLLTLPVAECDDDRRHEKAPAYIRSTPRP